MAEDWMESIRREYREARNRCYFRGVANGDYQDTPDAKAAFVAGWNGVHEHKQAKEERNTAGMGSSALAVAIGMFACFIPLCLILGWWTGLPIAWGRAPWLVGLSIAAIPVTLWLIRRARRKNLE